MPRILIALSLLLLVPACADSASVDLPRIATVGATPAELGLEQVVVTVTRDGRIFTVDGEMAPAGLAAWLTPHANRSRDPRYEQRPSDVHLVIRGDLLARWSSVEGVLQAAADPENRMNRVLFAVRPDHGADDREGAFACFLPLDSGLDAGSDADVEESIVILEVKRTDSLQSVLVFVDQLHRAGHRPLVVGGEEFDLLMETEDGEYRSAAPTALAGPGEPPGRSPDLAGITILREVLLPVILDGEEVEGSFELPPAERIGD